MSQLLNYKLFLNGEDRYLPDLPLQSIRAKGSTMDLWEASLDPYISILPSSTPSVLLLILDIPGCAMTAHIGIYLPTRSLEQEWTIAMGLLSMTVEDILTSHPGIPIYIRGDDNTNPNHPTRPGVLTEFLNQYGLASLSFGYSTYHHFTGNGASDSQLDVLISSRGQSDSLIQIICKHEDALITSSHDHIISSFKFIPEVHHLNPLTWPLD